MHDLKLLGELLLTSGYKKDEVVKCICGTASLKRSKALGSYSRLCEVLLDSGKTLSEYIFGLAADKGYDVPEENTAAYKNIIRDINILSQFAQIRPYAFISDLRERFGISEDVIFPLYENGNAEITPDTVSEYRRRYGSTVYAANKAFIYSDGRLSPVSGYDCISLAELKKYEAQRGAVIENTLFFLNGQRYSSVLLCGDRGTGKTGTVKAIVNEFPQLRLIFVPKDEMTGLYDIYEKVKNIPLKFILFIDDLTFTWNEPEYTFLKQALEGSVCIMPDNCAVYATTDTHITAPETSSGPGDMDSADGAGEEKSALSDSFGLSVTFTLPDRNDYLDIVRQIAADRKLGIPEEKLFKLAEEFAHKKGVFSPETARQAVDRIEARTALGLEND